MPRAWARGSHRDWSIGFGRPDIVGILRYKASYAAVPHLFMHTDTLDASPTPQTSRAGRAWLMYVCVPVPSFDASWGGIASTRRPEGSDADSCVGQTTMARGVVTVRLLPLRSGSDKPQICCLSPLKARQVSPCGLPRRAPPPVSVPARVTCTACCTCKHPACRW